jgi:glycosyltransferase involved in cell wall biosynthesis
VTRPPREPAGRLRVCHVAAVADGATWMLEQLRELHQRRGHHVTAVISSTPGPLGSRLRAAGIRAIPFDFGGMSARHLLNLPWVIIRLARLLRQHRFDVVQTHLFQSMIIGRLAAWLADVPVRITMVSGPFHLEAPVTRSVDAATCWMDSRLIGSCRTIVDIYRGLGVKDERLALVYYGPDETRFDPASAAPRDLRTEYGWPAGTPVIGHVAWFYPRLPHRAWVPRSCQGRSFKGHEELIRAAPLILREHPQARIVFIGGGWQAAGTGFMREMMDLVAQLGLQEHVVFAGAQADIPNIYRALDVAVQPSLTESLGGTLESLLLACPTVATRVGGLPDAVIDGQTGVLVNPQDPVNLARGISELLSDPDRARVLGQAGRAHVLRIATLSKTVADLDALYRDALFPNGRRRRAYRWWVSLSRLPVLAAVAMRLIGPYVLSAMPASGGHPSVPDRRGPGGSGTRSLSDGAPRPVPRPVGSPEAAPPS